jgi:serine/threonine-protein kinase
VAFQIGDTVGDYEVVGFLGRGGMGQVYKVRHRLDRLDAMKVLPPDREDAPQLHRRFEREIRVQAGLQHPNIAALHTALWVDRRLPIVEFSFTAGWSRVFES